jgi:[acyl-carrier-protein] S-malonyltransferase
MIAAIYPGQGSQHVGMGKYLHNEFKVAREVFEEASDAARVNLQRLCFDGSELDLGLTANTQPALLAVSTATYRVLESLGLATFAIASGHSIGEYAALVNAKSIGFTDGIRAVRLRGQAMQDAVPVGLGAMAAILGAEDKPVRDFCAWVTESGAGVLEPANFNSPGQIVVSGHKAALEWATSNYSPDAFIGAPQRLKIIPLKVSAPFHCSLMVPAENKMRDVLKAIPFAIPKYPVVQNYSAETTAASEQVRENLIRQIAAPVRWVECVEKLLGAGARDFVEVGCGKVLSGLLKKIANENVKSHNLNSLDELKNFEKTFSGLNKQET